MNRRNTLSLFVPLSVLLPYLYIGSISPCLALPSSAFSSLQPQGRAYSQTEHERMYGKQNSVSKDDDSMEQYENDDQAPTKAVTYGHDDQSGLINAGADHKVETQKPQAQAQKVKEQSFSNTLTQWSYKNMGNGVNVGTPTPPSGSNWYSFPPSRQIQSKPQGAAALAVMKFMPKMPKPMESAMPTNSVMQANYMATAFAASQLMNAPKRQVSTAKANMGAQQQEISDSTADAAESGFATGIDEAGEPLINVANESTGTPGQAESPTKTYEQAIWMVQQIYKKVYVPMAVLLLLPGAVLTNFKGLVSGGLLGAHEDEDAVSPFSGIIRSIVAIFLIPAMQLFASWAIDVGNSMTYEVRQHIQPAEMMKWMQQQTFNAPTKNAKNALSMPKDSSNVATPADERATGGSASDNFAGKIDGGPEEQSQVEQQGAATRMLQMAFNMINVALNFGLLMLAAFQTVMICYLFLMAPIAAAFFAWPAGVGSLFKPVFSNWVDAVINVSLWKFWWCVVILCMQTRIEWLQEAGMYLPNSQWEVAVYTAFMVILLYVPFVPFEYKPGEMVSKILQKAEELQQAASSGGGGGGGGGHGGGGGGHAGAGHGGKSAGSHTSASHNATPSHFSGGIREHSKTEHPPEVGPPPEAVNVPGSRGYSGPV